MNSNLETPILFIIFNRPETTERVFTKIREIKPRYLFIAADGPRKDRIEENKKCKAARDIINQVDWDCKLSTLFHENNLGCKLAVSTAISWFFDNIKAGIILEDDCLPSNSFFFFCRELLERYKNDDRVMMISGNNFHNKDIECKYSYYFSRYSHIWGWATWSRAWQLYDVDIKQWPHQRDNKILDKIFNQEALSRLWEKIFDNVYKRKLDTWDYQWVYTCFLNNGLSIVPEVNLISNIGFDEGATHIKDANNKYAKLESFEIKFPLRHPPKVESDQKLDLLEEKEMYIPYAPSWINILKHRFRRNFKLAGNKDKVNKQY